MHKLASFGFVPVLLLGLAASFPLTGCGLEADDDTGSLEQEKRVKPNGNEKHVTGTAIVKVPPGAPALAVTQIQFTANGFTASPVTTNLDTAASLPVGKWDVRVAGSNAATIFGTIEVKGGQTTTVVLPVLAPVARTSTQEPPRVAPPAFTWGPAFAPINPAAVSRVPSIRIVGGGSVYSTPIGAQGGIVLVPGATYEIFRRNAAGNGDDILQSLAVQTNPQVYNLPAVSDMWVPAVFDVPQTELSIDIEGSDFVAQAPVLAWTCSAASDAAKNYTSVGGSGSRALRPGNAASTQETLVGKMGTAGCRYQLNLASGAVVLDTTQPTTKAAIHFLDVEHVHLTHENGTTRDVPGKMKLSRIPGPGQQPVAISDFVYDTNRAYPVAAGTYLVEIRYVDNTNAYKVYSEQITFP